MSDTVKIAPTGGRAKALGAFYTPDKAVNFMVRWAVQQTDFNVIDPSFGDGVFLKASRHQVANPSEQIYGIELDEVVYNASKKHLDRYQIMKLWQGNFFASDSFFRDNFGRTSPVEAFAAVVGNPPFIRYQSFKGKERSLGLQRAADLGVYLPGHVSSWAPFLVHAVSLIKPGGRLAMVAPAELGHAAYAQEVLAFLLEQFATLNILTFKKRLFPKLGEDTLIVLGEAKGGTEGLLNLIDVENEDALDIFAATDVLASVGQVKKFCQEEVTQLSAGRTRLLEHLVDSEIRALYQHLSLRSQVKTFSSIARIGIGYVTGNNDFFHLSQAEIDTFNIPMRYCTPCFRRSNNLKGLLVSEGDWQQLKEERKWLLEIPANEPFENLPEGLRTYLQKAEKSVRKGYKVSKRDPWYAVPHIKRGAALLTYMSNSGPRLVHNTLCAPAPNTLHTVELPQTIYEDSPSSVDIKLLVTAWYTSLTFLSAEIEGHSLGGGMLKLEPGEARKVLLALPDLSDTAVDEAYKTIDARLREGDLEGALELGDTLMLRRGLGLSVGETDLLRRGYHHLRDRRMKR